MKRVTRDSTRTKRKPARLASPRGELRNFVLAKLRTFWAFAHAEFGEIPERNSRPAGPEDLRQGQFGVPGGAQRGVVARDRIYGGLPLTKGVFMGDLWACGVLRQ